MENVDYLFFATAAFVIFFLLSFINKADMFPRYRNQDLQTSALEISPIPTSPYFADPYTPALTYHAPLMLHKNRAQNHQLHWDVGPADR